MAADALHACGRNTGGSNPVIRQRLPPTPSEPIVTTVQRREGANLSAGSFHAPTAKQAADRHLLYVPLSTAQCYIMSLLITASQS